MDRWMLYLIEVTEEDEEHIMDVIPCSSREEAIIEKDLAVGPNGIYAGCRVYAKIVKQ